MRGLHLGTRPTSTTPGTGASGRVTFIVVDDVVYLTDPVTGYVYEAPVTFVGPTTLPSGLITAEPDTLLFHYAGGTWQSPATQVEGAAPVGGTILNDTFYVTIASVTYAMPVTATGDIPGMPPGGETSLVVIDGVEYLRIVFPDGEVRYEQVNETPTPDAEGGGVGDGNTSVLVTGPDGAEYEQTTYEDGTIRYKPVYETLPGGEVEPPEPPAPPTWESDINVTGSPASSWASILGTLTLAQGTVGSQPTVTASAFGSTQGLTFDGTADYLSVTGKPITSTGAASLSVVFKTPPTVTGPGVIVSQADSALANDWWEFGIASDGKLYVESNAAGTKHTVKGSTVLAGSTVYSAILTYDGTDFYLLLDNVEENPLVIENVGTFAWAGRVGGTTVFAVGATVTSGGAARFFNGTVGAVYFWDTDITA